MASQETLNFSQCELDDVLLTDDEYTKHLNLTTGYTDRDSGKLETRQYQEYVSSVTSISGLTTIPVNVWNHFAQNVYTYFDLKSYIVEPDYFLSVSVSDEYLASMNTINGIFDNIARNCQPYFQLWCKIEPLINSLLHTYNDTEDLPINLHEKAAARKTVFRFQQALEGSMKTLSHEWNSDELARFQLHVTSVLLQWSNDLMEAIGKQQFSETLSRSYIFHLLAFFVHLMQSPITIREKVELPLDLVDKRRKQGQEMTVVPDIAMMNHATYYLVGEVKSHQLQNKGNKPQQNFTETYEDRRGPDAEQSSCDSTVNQEILLSEEEVEEHFRAVPRAKRMKLDEDETPSAISCDSDVRSANDMKEKRHFRRLRKAEEIKVERFLPELFAEMLAAKASSVPSRKTFYLGRQNKTEQLAFSVEGFKLRFARLVLRNVHSSEAPTVSMIRNANVKCDMFLTKEFNLFNKSHLKMFFKMLFAFSYECGV